MHSEKQTDLSQVGLNIAIQDIKEDLFDTPECDYTIAQLLGHWGQTERAEQMLDEMLLKWGTSAEILALIQRGYAEIRGGDAHVADNDEPVSQPCKLSPAASAPALEIVAA